MLDHLVHNNELSDSEKEALYEKLREEITIIISEAVEREKGKKIYNTGRFSPDDPDNVFEDHLFETVMEQMKEFGWEKALHGTWRQFLEWVKAKGDEEQYCRAVICMMSPITKHINFYYVNSCFFIDGDPELAHDRLAWDCWNASEVGADLNDTPVMILPDKNEPYALREVPKEFNYEYVICGYGTYEK